MLHDILDYLPCLGVTEHLSVWHVVLLTPRARSIQHGYYNGNQKIFHLRGRTGSLLCHHLFHLFELFLHCCQMLSLQPVNAVIICEKTDQVQLHGLSHTDQPFLIHLNQYSLVVFSPDHIGKRDLPFVDEGQRSPVHPVAFAPLIEKTFPIQNIINLVFIFIKSDRLR